MNVARLLGECDLDTDELRRLVHPIQPERLSLKPASPLMMSMWGRGISGMTVGRWIFVDPAVLNGDKRRLARLTIHELAHVRQWHELGFFGLLWRYLSDYVRGRWIGLGHRDAYLAIGMEVEARWVQARVLRTTST